MRLIIIGGVAAGAKAAMKARRVDPNLEIILYQDEAEIAYSACGMPYKIGGLINDFDNLIIRKPEDFAELGVSVYIRHCVTGIDPANRRITVKNLQNNTDAVVAYDRLILATGARPIVPKLPGIDLEGVVTLRNISDLNRFEALMDRLQPKQAVITGAGYIGLELAEALTRRGMQTTLLEQSAVILPRFDAEMAQHVHRHLLENNVKLIVGDGLAKLRGEQGRVTSVETASDKIVAAGLVLIAVGIRPNIELATAAGITLGTSGAIAVDARMETGIPGIFAAGDCCETIERITGSALWMPLGDIANLQGRVAGTNAAGGNARFPGVFGTAIFKVFNLHVAITGLSEKAARASGLEPVSVVTTGTDRARYYPGRQALTIKLIARQGDGRLLGAQVIGCGAVDKTIDIAATALLGKLSCEDLAYADLAYSPPFSPVLSPIIVAAGALKNKIAQTARLSGKIM